MLELVPFRDLNPESTGIDLHELLNDATTRDQLVNVMPEFVKRYGETVEMAVQRVKEVIGLTNQNNGLEAYAHIYGGVIIGSATIDDRVKPYRHRPLRSLQMGKISLLGPSTSCWLAADFQGTGLGRESLDQRIKIATSTMEHPGLWAKVRNSNSVSRSNLSNRGFQVAYDDVFWLGGVQHNDSRLMNYRL